MDSKQLFLRELHNIIVVGKAGRWRGRRFLHDELYNSYWDWQEL